MSFVQTDFLPFLLVVLTAYAFAPGRARKPLLLAASLAFYAYREPAHVLLLLVSAALDFVVGLRLEANEEPARRRAWLAVSLSGNLGLLAFFKYGAMIAGLFGVATAAEDPADGGLWSLPLGISFYTFQTISYSVDVYRRKVRASRDPLEYALYVAFFPQLVAGPIERAGRLLPQLRELAAPRLEDLSWGARLVAWGFVKKTVCADRLRLFAWPAFEDPAAYDSASLLLAACVMLVVLYLDFSAYTDIARGCARMFGVRLVRNFDRPFLSTSIPQMWSRWHMSLTSWITDYVYSPLASAPPSHPRIWLVNLAALGLFGLWHGASWKFLVWGLANGALVAAYQSARLAGWIAPRSGASTRRRRVVHWAATMLASATMIVFFFAPDFATAFEFVRHMVAFDVLLEDLRRPALWAGTGILAAGLCVHALGARVDLEALWSRIGLAGRVAWFTGLIALTLRYSLEAPREFVYFAF